MDFRGFYDEIIFDVDSPILKSYTGKQGDTKSRGLYVTVTQRNVVIKNLAGLSMKLFYEKPDKTRGFIDGVVDGDKFRIDYTNQMFAVPGVVKAELRLIGTDGEIITGKTFKILVDSSIADGSIVSKNERGILDRAFELAEDIIPRLELLDVELLEDVQNEMLQYQLKVAKVEKELNDYKATMQQINIHQSPTQKASGHVIVSLPPNAAEGQVSGIRIKGLTATNLVKNGDFSNGFHNWLSSRVSNIIPSDKEISFIATGIYGNIKQNISFIPGYKYYARALVKSDSNMVRLILQRIDGHFFASVNHSGSGDYELLTVVGSTTDSVDSTANLAIMDYRSSDFTAVSVKEVMLIDLTSIFGAGNEPSKEQCDQIFANWFDGTKSTLNARVKSVGKNLFNKSRALKGYRLNPNNGSQELSTRPALCSDFIRVNSNEQYYISGLLNKSFSFAAYYDKDKRFTRRSMASIRDRLLISDLQDNEKYIRITAYENASVLPTTWEDIDDILNNLQVERSNVATAYETYRESNAYVIAKNEQGNVLELRSLPNGIKDEINVTDGKLIRRIGEKSNIANGMVVDFADMAEGGMYYAWNDDGETEAGVKGDTLGIDATTLIYQLAEPIEIPVQVSGTLLSYPSGTVYVENFVADAGLYSNGITVLHQDLPIKSIEKISKIDYETGLETILDASKAVIASDRLSFTHPDLKNDDIVFFIYEYDRESIVPEVEVEFYDSRYVVKDTETGKFYKWNIVVANGQPSIKLVEV